MRAVMQLHGRYRNNQMCKTWKDGRVSLLFTKSGVGNGTTFFILILAADAL